VVGSSIGKEPGEETEWRDRDSRMRLDEFKGFSTMCKVNGIEFEKLWTTLDSILAALCGLH